MNGEVALYDEYIFTYNIAPSGLINMLDLGSVINFDKII